MALPNSTDVVAGTNATASERNNLRADALTRQRVYKFEVQGTLTTGDNQGGEFIVPRNETVKSIRYYIDSGTSATIRVQHDTTDIEAGMSATTTVGETKTGFDSASLTEGEKLSLDITAVSGSPVRLVVQVETEYQLSDV